MKTKLLFARVFALSAASPASAGRQAAGKELGTNPGRRALRNGVFLLFQLSAFSLLSASELVLSTDTKPGGVITTVTVGRIQADPAADGAITLAVIPRSVVKLQDGTIISDGFAGEWLTVKLSDALVAQLNAEILAAKQSADAAKAAAPAEPK